MRVVLDRVDEGEALEEAAVGLGRVGDQLCRGGLGGGFEKDCSRQTERDSF